jgi:hypothetical protein
MLKLAIAQHYDCHPVGRYPASPNSVSVGMLEPVTGPSADQPNAIVAGRPVDQEVSVRAVLVLANPCVDQRGPGQGGKPLGEVLARAGDPIGAHLARLGVRLDHRTVRVECELEALPFQVRKAVDDLAVVEVGPNGQGARGEARVAGRRAEVVDLLARGDDAPAQNLGEQGRQPRAACID